MTVNSRHCWKGTTFLNKIPLDISSGSINISASCRPGLNTLTLGNPSNDAVIVKLQIDLNDFTDLNSFIQRIPDDVNSFVDISSLSIDESGDLFVIAQKCQKICPITGLPFHYSGPPLIDSVVILIEMSVI